MRRHATVAARTRSTSPASAGPRAMGTTLGPVIPARAQALVDATSDLAARFDDAGHRLYVVGGSVRDVFGSDEPSFDADIDLTTDAVPDETEKIVGGWADAVWLQGKRWGTIGARKAGRTIEITTHRAEAYQPDSRKPEVVFGDSIEVDLSRRDFTVNAMALRLGRHLELIDPYGGLADLAAGRLRTPLDPEVSFSDDPLRMLRAARFIAGFGLRARRGPRGGRPRHARPAGHRLGRAHSRRAREAACGAASPLRGCGSWSTPDWPASSYPSSRPWPSSRTPSTGTRTFWPTPWPWWTRRARERLLRLAALLHDIGKPRTRDFGPGGVTFHHHEVVGARMARDRMTALRFSNEDIETVTRLVELHLRFHTYRLGWTDRAVRRYVRDAGPLLDAAERAHPLRLHDPQRGPGARPRAADGRAREDGSRNCGPRRSSTPSGPSSTAARSWTSSAWLPGPDVGRALDFLLELRLEEGPLGEEEARRRLDAWWAEDRSRAGSEPAGSAGQSSGQRRVRLRRRRRPPPSGGPRRRGYCTGGDFMK